MAEAQGSQSSHARTVTALSLSKIPDSKTQNPKPKTQNHCKPQDPKPQNP